jgi:bifunctional DNA-binding transcriptional regulator/antitoxin component of YhaV-PrlF toxin-antitoxin module
MKFKAKLELHGKTATGIEVPEDVVHKLSGGKRVPVVVTINKHSYRSTVSVMRGQYLLPVAAEHREAAGIEAGQLVTVDVVPDGAERTVDVPDYLAKALDKAKARKAFDALSYTNRKEHVRSVESAKAEETRQRRIDKIIASLK